MILAFLYEDSILFEGYKVFIIRVHINWYKILTLKSSFIYLSLNLFYVSVLSLVFHC
jgi:hypothetical protein